MYEMTFIAKSTGPFFSVVGQAFTQTKTTQRAHIHKQEEVKEFGFRKYLNGSVVVSGSYVLHLKYSLE